MLNLASKRNKSVRFLKHKGALAALLATGFIPACFGQTFTYTNNDLTLGFRKTGIHQEQYEAVVNIGSATNYVNLQPGTTVAVPNFTGAQLTPDTFSELNFLNWSVTGFSKTNTAFVLPGYANNTLWVTTPRVEANTQSSAPQRLSFAQQGAVSTQIKSILSGASYLSGQNSAGPDNTAKFVREPVNNTANLSAFIASIVDSSQSTLHDSWPLNLESTTPANFTGTSIADFYEVRPTNDPQGNPIVDPHTGQATGEAYYVGFFTLKPDGTMTFTRGTGTVVVPPPAAPTLAITRSETTSTIAFTTDKNATYTLYYTDAAGLDKPLSAWTPVAAKIKGDGSAKEFQDSSGDTARFYRVSAE
jgi:hypothetical protein